MKEEKKKVSERVRAVREEIGMIQCLIVFLLQKGSARNNRSLNMRTGKCKLDPNVLKLLFGTLLTEVRINSDFCGFPLMFFSLNRVSSRRSHAPSFSSHVSGSI